VTAADDAVKDTGRADQQVYAELKREDFEGPLTRAFLERLVHYGVQTVAAWVRSGEILARSIRHNVPGSGSLQFEGQRFSQDDAIEIAGEVVARATKSYIEKVLRGGWSASKGNLSTPFITYCLFEFPNVYRRWRREETQRLEVTPLEEASDAAFDQDLPVGSAGDPAGIVEHRLDVLDALTRAVRDDRTRIWLILRAEGYSNQDIAHWFNVTEKAVEGVFYRHKQRLHPPTTPDKVGGVEDNKRVNTRMDEPIEHTRDSLEGVTEETWTVPEDWTWESPEELINRSSFGTPAVRTFCKRAAIDIVQRVVNQV
jgi:DNA-directed RNA polymerase specialized sigma24 family protein